MIHQLKQEILSLLKEMSIEFKYFEHDETPTSEDASKIRGTPLEQGVKALILKDEKTGENFMFCLQGHRKLDLKKCEELTNAKLTFEKPEVVLERFGLIIGGIPPFGELLGIKTFYDSKIFTVDTIDFNCGERTSSIEIKSVDYKKLIENSMIVDQISKNYR